MDHQPDTIQNILNHKILLVDGAMGTQIQARALTAADFGGAELEGCNENLNLTRPDVIQSIHETYLAAGADIIETNSFGSTPVVLAEYGLQAKAFDISKAAAEIARRATDKFSTPEWPRFVAGSMGPTTKTISVTGGISFDQLRKDYAVQAEGLIAGGADVLLLETAQDTLNVKAGLLGIQDAMHKLGRKIPIMLSVTIEPMGTMLAGQTIDALYASVMHFDLLSIGMNCATGPDFMTDHIRTLAEVSRFNVSCIPNAGLPDVDGKYNETPEILAKKVERFVDSGWVNIIGGCCGTTPEHIALMRKMLDRGKKPRNVAGTRSAVSLLSGLEPFVISEDKNPIIVGERTNVIGSSVFKKLIVGGEFEAASEIGRKQVRSGAHIVDVCLANPDRNELDDMNRFLDILVKKVKVPLMIDTTDAKILEEALKRIQGKCVYNSINLEDGEERFETVLPLLRQYGAAAVVGCIDDDPQQGMAVSVERKLQVAERSHQLLTQKYGLPEEDIIFDPLVFPCGTGDANYIGSAAKTVEGVRAIKQRFPRCKTVLGISNVSFGLPPRGREILNAVFLYHNVKAGLDLAIVNSEKLERYASIPENERQLAEDLIFWRGSDPVAAFAAYFRDVKVKPTLDERAKLSIDERLPRNVVEGSKEGLADDLNALLAEGRKPLDIINGPLMKGMDEVGRLFNANELIVAEVLQSAEVMKAAVAQLEPFMEKTESSTKGKILLATVKGDVHDIGKNLVEIILKNNGYNVINLGIKVPPEALIEAYKQHRPDAIGLSGLLVKSAQQMVVTASDFETAKIGCPVLVGGAALSRQFTHLRIGAEFSHPVIYASDAMNGLDIMNQLVDPVRREGLLQKVQKEIAQARQRAEESALRTESQGAGTSDRKSGIRHDVVPLLPPDLKPHEVTGVSLDEIFGYINPVMLYGKHLGLKGSFYKLIEARDEKALQLQKQVRALQDKIQEQKLLRPRGIFQFYRACSDANDLIILDASKKELLRFNLPRQQREPYLCLADFVAPQSSSLEDFIGMFVVTAGEGVMNLANRFKDEGRYFESHAIAAIALESAEAFAELLHKRIRSMWGIHDDPGLTLAQIHDAQYHSKRFSFGYQACPNLEDQAKLWQLLQPDSVGVRLTEEFMMEPEASVSALVFSHPQARYFNA